MVTTNLSILKSSSHGFPPTNAARRTPDKRRWGIVRYLLLRSGLLVTIFAARITLAHDPGLSTVIAQLHPGRLEAVITFAIKDAGELGGLDADLDEHISPDEFYEGREKLGLTVAENLEVRFDGEVSSPTNVLCQLDPKKNVEIHLSFPAKEFWKLVIRSKMIARFSIGHRQYCMLQNHDGVMLVERLLNAESDFVTYQPKGSPSVSSSPGKTPATVVSVEPVAISSPASNESHSMSFGQFIVLGIEHIWTGYDHLLFLLALLVVTRSFRSALVVITAFTVAHSITLAVATFDLMQLPARYTEPLIAASIVYVGVENLVRRGDPHGRWMLTFAFGLIHGFGFASVLRDLGVAERAGGVVMPLLSFNLGVEAGQIAVASVVLPLIWWLRKKESFVQRGVPACSIIVALAGTFWFVQRVWPG